MGNYFTQGLILRHINFREADRLISIYTEDRGLVNVVAKGARRIKSKLAGSLEPFTLAEFMIVKGKNYDTVASSEVINVYRGIKNDLTKIKLAYYFSKIILETAKEMQRDNKLYNYLLNIFDYLDKFEYKKNNKLNWLVWFFIWHYLKLSGYQPELHKCQVCKKSLAPDNLFFNYKKGGLIGGQCQISGDGSQSISTNLVKIIRTIMNSDSPDTLAVKLSPVLAQELVLHTKNYYSYVFETDIDLVFFKPN